MRYGVFWGFGTSVVETILPQRQLNLRGINTVQNWMADHRQESLQNFMQTVSSILLLIYDGWRVVSRKKPMESLAYAQLRTVHMRNLCSFFNAGDSVVFVWSLMDVLPDFSDVARLLREIQLRDLNLEHLDWKEMSPAYAHYGKSGKFSNELHWKYFRPRSSTQLKAFVSELQSLQETSSELKVVIFGGIPTGRVAVFYYPLEKEFDYAEFYTTPYPE